MLPFFKKKTITGYPKSFAKQLIWRIMLRMLIIMILPVFLLFWLTYGVVTIGALGIGDRVLKGEKEGVRRIASDLYMAANNTRPFIEEDLDKPDRMYDLMNRMLKLNPYMRSCGIYFIESYFPQKGRLFAPYASRRDSVIMESQDACDQGNDYVKAEWFKEAVSSKEGYWAKAFLDNDSAQSPLVSYLLPIRDRQHRTVAVLGVDLSLSWLSKKIQPVTMIHRQDKEWNPEFQIYYYMTDSAGTVLIHPDAKRLVKENIKSYMTKASGNKLGSLTINDSKQDEIKLDGEDVFINTQSVKHTDWYISIVIPRFFIHTAGFIVAGIAITFILIGLLVVYFFGRKSIKKAVRPLNQLATTADEVAKGNFKTELPELKSHDEIHLLRDSFEEMQLSLTKYIEQLQTTTAQKATMESELNIAHNIQMSMLPKTFPPYPQRSDVDIYGMLAPARAVGGDLFDFYIRDEHLFFCIGDVSGKGIPASLVMAVTRSLFRNISAHNSEPAAIVCSINEALVDNNDTGMFVTLFVGVLDLKTGRLLYCNGGHNPPLLISDQVTEMSCDPNLVVGIMPGYTFVAEETTLSHGSTIFLFTDGLNEAEDVTLSQFGDKRIHDVASSAITAHITKPADLVAHMDNAIHQFVGTAEQSDDLTMLAIRYY